MTLATWQPVAMDNAGEIVVRQVHAGDGDGADIVFEFNGQRMDVSIFLSLSRPGQVQQSLEDRLIDLLARATSPDTDDDEYEDIVDEVLETILDAGSHIFSEAAPTPSTDGIDLHSLVFPPTHVFRLETVDDNATIVRIDPEEEYTSSFLDRDGLF